MMAIDPTDDTIKVNINTILRFICNAIIFLIREEKKNRQSLTR